MNHETKGTHVYSYGTHVATIRHEERKVIAHGKWSRTTSGHVGKVARELGYKVEQDPAGQAGSTRVSGQTFGAQRTGMVKEDANTPEPDGLGGLLKIAAAFGALAAMNKDEKQAQRERERIVFATPGVIKPEGWDSLPFEERKRRTDAALDAAKH